MRTLSAVLREMGAVPPYARSKPLHLEELDLAPPGPGEILIRIRAAGLCHSDLSVINGERPRPMPMALGHEAAGEVEALGEGVTDLAIGDHVVLVFVPSCGTCPMCIGGRPALCEPGAASNSAGTLLSGARRLSRAREPIHHHLGCSAFAERAVVARHSAVRVDPALPFAEAALFGCAVLTGVGAVVNTAKVPAGASVAVVGLGGVGLAAVMGAVVAGAARIVAIDLATDKLDIARGLGATDTFEAGDADATVDAVRGSTNGGVDFAFDFAGAARATELAHRITGRGGTTITAGLPPPDASMAVPLVNLVAEERTIKGSYVGSSVPSRDVPGYIALYQQGRLPVDRLLSGTLGLDEINEGFDRLREGKAIRQVVLL